MVELAGTKLFGDEIPVKPTIEDIMIYTTGAFLQPLKIIDETGRESWVWVVSEFDGDSFKDGDVYNPKKYAKTKEELFEIED